MKIIGVIQARMKSQRLTGKVMLDLLGKPILWHIYNRLKHSNLLESVVIATGERANNEEICEFASSNNIPFYSGSDTDLISRLYETALHFQSSAIVRITGDSPLVDPHIVDKLVSEYVQKNNQYDIVTNSKILTFPYGLNVEVYSIGSLKRLWEEIKEPEIREWFPFYVEKHPELFRILNVTNPVNLSHLRWTLDYPEDYEFVKKIYENLYKEDYIFTLEDILSLIKKQPELTKINSKYAGFHNVGAPNI